MEMLILLVLLLEFVNRSILKNRWIGIDIKSLIQKYIEYLSIGISAPNNNMDILVCIVWASRTSKVLKVVILILILMLMLMLILIYILPVKVV